MMRGTPGMRLAMAILSPIFLLLCVVAIYSEETRPWMAYQEEFNDLYLQRASAKLEEATGRGDEKDQARWQRVVNELKERKPEIAQIYLDDIKVADRCTTCHLGIDNPLFADAPEPFRTHPGEFLQQHDPQSFACTPCHQGQGTGTTVEGGHGHEENWLKPLLPPAHVQATCANCHEVTHGVKGAEAVTRGADLFMEKGCYGCHNSKGVRYLPKFSPPLKSIKRKLKKPEDWTYAWVKAPADVSPDTAMPRFKLTDDEVGKIAAYLMSVTPGEAYKSVSLEGASAEEGEKLFTERGCRGCHAVKEDEKSVNSRVPHLAGIGSKVTTEWLDAWIADPKKYNADAAMPKLELTDEERHHLVAYLMKIERKTPLPAAPNLSQFDVEEGKQLIKKNECFGCHAIEGFEDTRPAVPDLAEFARKPVDELDFASTTDVPRTKWDWLMRKLKEPQAYETDLIKLYMPMTPASDEENAAIISYVLAFETPTLPDRYTVKATPALHDLRDAKWMLAHLNCNGCHQINQKEAHIAQFLERKSQSGPNLDGVGGRLQGDYFYKFLLEPKQVRPWLKMRMPTFGFSEAQTRMLTEGLAAEVNVVNPYTYVAKIEVEDSHFQRGLRRFRHYKCVQCHPTSIDQGLPEDVDPDDLSINLMLSKTRIRPEWFKEFMARPKDIAGINTRMPTVFYTVDGVPKVEKPQEDIDDITTYIMGMTEPPEEAIAKLEAERKAEEEAIPDWTQFEY